MTPRTIITNQQKLAKLTELVCKMRQAQIAYEEMRGYGTLVRLPLEKKAQALEQQVDKYLEDGE